MSLFKDILNAIQNFIYAYGKRENAEKAERNQTNEIQVSQLQEQRRANTISEEANRITRRNNVYLLVGIIANFIILAIYGWMAIQSQTGLNRNKDQYELTLMADIEFNQIAVIRHPYYALRHKSDSVNISFQLYNTTGQSIKIDKIKYKWLFDSDEIADIKFKEPDKIVSAFKNVKNWQLDSEYYGRNYCGNEYFPGYACTAIQPKDTTAIDNANRNLFLMEVHYHVQFTTAYFVYRYVAAIRARAIRDTILDRYSRSWFTRYNENFKE